MLPDGEKEGGGERDRRGKREGDDGLVLPDREEWERVGRLLIGFPLGSTHTLRETNGP